MAYLENNREQQDILIAKQKADYEKWQRDLAEQREKQKARLITTCTCDDPDRLKILHPCPLQEEIYGNNEAICTCCSHCTDQCAMDI